MDSVPKYLGVGLVAITIIYFLIALIHRHPQPKFRRVIGLLFIVYGIYLATITKTSTHFVLPFSSVAQGAGGGAVAGLLTGLIVGTVGVVTGGVGIAVGALAMTLGGAILGGIGGTAAGFGWKTVTEYLVPWYFWLPIILFGLLLFIGWRKKNIHTENRENAELPRG